MGIAVPSHSVMATPFLVGLGVAGTAYAAKGAIHVFQKLQANPETLKTMQAAGAGLALKSCGRGLVCILPRHMRS